MKFIVGLNYIETKPRIPHANWFVFSKKMLVVFSEHLGPTTKMLVTPDDVTSFSRGIATFKQMNHGLCLKREQREFLLVFCAKQFSTSKYTTSLNKQ